MFGRTSLIVTLVMTMFVLASCNLPSRQTAQGPSLTETSQATPIASPQPVSLCSNTYFPSTLGYTWEYSGSNTILGAYIRTDRVTNSSESAFVINTNQAGITYTQIYTCSAQGLLTANPVQQYAGALLSNTRVPLNVEITSNAGISLPAQLAPGDTWQQTADFEASSQDLNLNGRFVFDYNAVDFEQVTIPFGTLNALRVDATIRIEVTGLHILAGTYTSSTWLAAGIGVVKSQGSSQVPRVDFRDAMQLTQFTLSP